MYFPAAFIISFFNICIVWGEQLTRSDMRSSLSLSFAMVPEAFRFLLKILIASLLSAKQSSQNSFFHIEILEGDFFPKKPMADIDLSLSAKTRLSSQRLSLIRSDYNLFVIRKDADQWYCQNV